MDDLNLFHILAPNIRRNETVPKEALIVVIDEQTTLKARTRNFNVNDFLFTAEGFDVNAQNNVRDELRALNNRQDRVADLVKRITGLTVQQIRR